MTRSGRRSGGRLWMIASLTTAMFLAVGLCRIFFPGAIDSRSSSPGAGVERSGNPGLSPDGSLERWKAAAAPNETPVDESSDTDLADRQGDSVDLDLAGSGQDMDGTEDRDGGDTPLGTGFSRPSGKQVAGVNESQPARDPLLDEIAPLLLRGLRNEGSSQDPGAARALVHERVRERAFDRFLSKVDDGSIPLPPEVQAKGMGEQLDLLVQTLEAARQAPRKVAVSPPTIDGTVNSETNDP